jgi:hypothetical protein
MDHRIKSLNPNCVSENKERETCTMFTSQMKVKRSCHLAFFGSNALDPMYATRPTISTAAKELAEVLVNNRGAEDSDMIVGGEWC